MGHSNSPWWRPIATAACLLLALAVDTAYADWPQFQGPARNGISPETGLARMWPDDGPRVRWTVPVQEGYGGPAIRDGEVFILDREDSRRDVLRCIDLATGEQRWRVAYEAPGSTSHNGSRAIPTVTDTHVFTVGLMGHFTCFSREARAIEWQIDLEADYGKVDPKWGFAQSPVLYQDLVIIAPQSPRGFVAAYRQHSGERVWASENLGGQGYVSPIVTALGGVDQVVMVNAPGDGPGTVHGLSLNDGTRLWSYGGWKCRIPIPSATPLPDDRLFITGEYGAGSAMIKIGKSTDRFYVRELYKTDACESQIHQPLVIGDMLYLNSNGNRRSDGMICMTFNGQVLWRTADDRGQPAFERGNLMYADGMILNLDGRTGILHLVSPSTSGYVELDRAKVFDGQRMWAPMALSDGKLVLRSQSEMKCLDLRNP